MNKGEWEEESELEEIRKDNEILEARLRERGGATGFGGDMDPRLRNEFLRHVLAFEEMSEGPKRTIRSLFPDDFDFPAPESMTPEALEKKLDEILDVLEANLIVLELQAGLQAVDAYKYFLGSVMDSEISLERIPDMWLHLDGCDGSCPDCFQNGCCETGQEMYPDGCGPSDGQE